MCIKVKNTKKKTLVYENIYLIPINIIITNKFIENNYIPLRPYYLSFLNKDKMLMLQCIVKCILVQNRYMKPLVFFLMR